MSPYQPRRHCGTEAGGTEEQDAPLSMKGPRVRIALRHHSALGEIGRQHMDVEVGESWPLRETTVERLGWLAAQQMSDCLCLDGCVKSVLAAR
jgi:hypothetical protein